MQTIYLILVLFLTIINIYICSKDYSLRKRYYLILIAIALFDFSTQMAWITNGLPTFTYLGQYFNWIMTLAWSGIVFQVMLGIDKLKINSEGGKFCAYTLGLSIAGLFFEYLLVNVLHIRSYAAEVLQAISGLNIPLLSIPIEALYYIPVFMILSLGFIRYFEVNEPKKRGRS